MKFYKKWEEIFSLSIKAVASKDYQAAEITYKEKVTVPATKLEKQEKCVTCAETGKKIVLDTIEVEVPVTKLEKVKVPVLDEEWNPVKHKNGKVKTTTETKEVPQTKEVIVEKRYNKYDGYVIIPDGAVEITEAEYKAIMKASLQPKTK